MQKYGWGTKVCDEEGTVVLELIGSLHPSLSTHLSISLKVVPKTSWVQIQSLHSQE
jgi:hypothetical protein